jgi:hypothetical protein
MAKTQLNYNGIDDVVVSPFHFSAGSTVKNRVPTSTESL